MAPTILARSDRWLAVDKPAGLPVIPARDGDPRSCLRAVIEEHLGRKVLVVHRIDRDATGVVLFALDAGAHRELCLAFERRQVRKSYTAVVAGVPGATEGRILTALHSARKGRMRPATRGEPGRLECETRWRLVEPFRTAALLEVEPRTGRRHQIRVHLRSVGHPLLVDPIYGGPPIPGVMDRLALHAAALNIPDAALGARGEPDINVRSPLPGDFARLLSHLRSDPGAAP